MGGGGGPIERSVAPSMPGTDIADRTPPVLSAPEVILWAAFATFCALFTGGVEGDEGAPDEPPPLKADPIPPRADFIMDGAAEAAALPPPDRLDPTRSATPLAVPPDKRPDEVAVDNVAIAAAPNAAPAAAIPPMIEPPPGETPVINAWISSGIVLEK